MPQNKVRSMAAVAYMRMPKRVQHGLLPFVARRTWKRAGVIFVHIPKTGGTSISNALYGRVTRTQYHVTAKHIIRLAPDLAAKLPILAVSRNPWDRAVSAYHFARQRGTQLLHPSSHAAFSGPIFRTFDSFVEEWLAEVDLAKTKSIIFREQSVFVEDQAGRLIVDHVGRMEDMASIANYVFEQTGRRIDIGQLNKTERNTDYRNYYTSARLRNIVGDIYSDDVERFNYSF